MVRKRTWWEGEEWVGGWAVGVERRGEVKERRGWRARARLEIEEKRKKELSLPLSGLTLGAAMG